MINRLTFLLISAFWVVMNVLLWRSEFGQRDVGTAPRLTGPVVDGAAADDHVEAGRLAGAWARPPSDRPE